MNLKISVWKNHYSVAALKQLSSFTIITIYRWKNYLKTANAKPFI